MTELETNLNAGDKVRFRTSHTIKPSLEPDLTKSLNNDKKGNFYTGEVVQDSGLGVDTYVLRLDQEYNNTTPTVSICLSNTTPRVKKLNGDVLDNKNSILGLKTIN